MNLNEHGHWTDRVTWPTTPVAAPTTDPVADWLGGADDGTPPTLDELSAAIDRGHAEREAAS